MDTRKDASQADRSPELAEARDSSGGRATIYDVARVAGVATSTVSRALSQPGRVSFRTAEHVRRVAEQIGYHSAKMERVLPEQSTGLLAVVVADITNPVFHGMVRGAERTAAHAGYTMVMVETQESEHSEREALQRVLPAVDGLVLTSSRMSDTAIRAVAKRTATVVLNRMVGQVASVATDNVKAVKRAAEHLAALGHPAIAYLSGPEASWADGMRWRGLREAGYELDLKVRRIGPSLPTMRGGASAAEEWLEHRTSAVIAYNDLVALGFIQTVMAAGVRVPEDVSVVGFDNIMDAELVSPRLTTLAAPLVSLGSAAVNHLLNNGRRDTAHRAEPVLLPARLVTRDSTGTYAG
ncbi:MAG: LacI family DNA-binding transcriptional regulator [Propionibacteriaceae bacterium]